MTSLSMKIPSVKLNTPSTSNMTNTKLPSFKMPKAPSIKIGQPKVPVGNMSGAASKFNFGKFSKQPKIPKEKQLKVLKSAIKKSKNAGF